MAKEYTSGEGTGDKIGSALCSRSDSFWYNYESGNATTEVEVLASPTATGACRYITDLVVSHEAAMAWELRGNTTSGSPAAISVGFPKQYGPANTVRSYHFSQPYKVPTGIGINLKAYSAGNITLWIGGYTI